MNRVRKTLGGVACAAGLATLISTSRADAQSVNGWALDRYEPTPAGDVFFMAEPKASSLVLPTLAGASSAVRLDGGGCDLTGTDPVGITLAAPFAGAAPHAVALKGARIRHG